MRELRYPYRISEILQFLLVFAGLALFLNPAERLGIRAAPVDDDLYRARIGPEQLAFRRHHAPGKGQFVSEPPAKPTTTELPLLHDQLSSNSTPPPTSDGAAATPVNLNNGTTILRLHQVVHETNKVILLTNGEEIKLYPLRESDLTPSGGYYVIKSKLNFTTANGGWKRPLISDVGYVFDNRFCTSSKHPWTLKSNCLVIFWLDKRNKLFRYGSFMFTHSSRIELLSSKFNAYGNLKSLSDKNKKTILLEELPPIDLCKRANELDYRLLDCDVSSLTIDRSNQEILVSFNASAMTNKANHQQAKKHVTATMSAYIGKTPLDFQNIDISPARKEIEIPDAIAMTANNLRCQQFWLNANYELYSSNLAGQDAQLIEKLSPRPAIRMLGEIHSYRDILFFSDMATKSIMSYNITQRASVIRRSKPQTATGRKKFEMVQRLEPTHHVLLVETSTINKFSIIDLKDNPSRTESACKPESFEEPRVIDDNLTDHLRKQKLHSDYEQHLLEDIMQMALIVLSILLIIFIITDKTRVKQVKSDRETFFNQVEP